MDNDGNALLTGALYYRTTTPVGMKVYDGTQWLEASAAQQSLMVTYEFVATAGQTTFSGTDANGATLSYVANSISVSLNGVTLRPGDDYTATNGTSIVLNVAAALNDELMVIAFAVFNVANAVAKTGDTMTGSLLLPAGTVSAPALTTSADTNTGMFFPAADTIAFAEGGTESMRLDSSGTVGIGTSSPDNKLHVSQASSDFQVRVTGTSAANAGAIRAYNAGGEASVFGTTGSSNTGYGANLGVLGTVTNIPQVFVTNNTERARIDSSGTVIVNSTSKQNGDVKFSVTANSGAAMETKFTGDYYALLIYRNANLYGSIYQSGTSTAYNTTSDYRLKEDVQPMIGALAVISELKPVTYKWKENGLGGQGFIAHELAEVVPDCVTGEKDALDENGNALYQGIDTSFLVATLTAAIQEQQAMIEILQAEVALLKGAA